MSSYCSIGIKCYIINKNMKRHSVIHEHRIAENMQSSNHAIVQKHRTTSGQGPKSGNTVLELQHLEKGMYGTCTFTLVVLRLLRFSFSSFIFSSKSRANLM